MCYCPDDSAGGESPATHTGHSSFNPRGGTYSGQSGIKFYLVCLCVSVYTSTEVFPDSPHCTCSPFVYQFQIQSTSVIATPSFDNLLDRHLSASYSVGACYRGDC